MDLLILPGNSPGNRLWAQKVAESFSTEFDKVVVLEYESWKTNDFEKIINLDFELNKIANVVSSMSDYSVFAKSVGTALCMKAVAEKVINPRRSVFVGIPLEWLATNNILIRNWVKDYHIPTMVVQQKNDPFGSAKIVSDFLSSIDSITNFSIIEGDDHKYSDVALLISKSVSFFSEK